MITIHLKSGRDHQVHVVADEQGMEMLRHLGSPERGSTSRLYEGLPIYRYGECPCNRLKPQ